MKAGLHTCWCLLGAALTGTASGTGITYPNNSVSPFRPGFSGTGIPSGATASRAYAVAATAGAAVVAVGDADYPGQGNLPMISGNGQVGFLDRSPNAIQGIALGVSGDGRIKVGQSAGAVYWDVNNAVHSLAGLPEKPSVIALGISADGSTIAGYITGGDDPSEAVLWRPGQAGLERLGQLPGFHHSYANSLSDDGVVVCGYSSQELTTPPFLITRSFRKLQGQPMEDLGSLGNATETLALCVSENGGLIGGISGTTGFVWNGSTGMSPCSGHGEFRESAVYGIRAGARTPGRRDGGRSIGSIGSTGGEKRAYMWDAQGYPEGEIREMLRDIYLLNLAVEGWTLQEATGISADGYTICGLGNNPLGKDEGWIAVMPPVYFPPKLTSPGVVIAKPNRLIERTIPSTRLPGDVFIAAKGLPAGFNFSLREPYRDSIKLTGKWTPGEGQPRAGSYTVTVTAKDFEEGSGSTTFELRLESVFEQLLRGQLHLPNAKPEGESIFLSSVSNGISADGAVAVGSDSGTGEPRAYLWSASDGTARLPMLPGALRAYSTANATSADGRVIGGQAAAVVAGVDRAVAVVWNVVGAAGATSARITDIGLFPRGIVSVATGVSGDGSVVVGYGDLTIQGDPYQAYQAFRWTQAGGLTGLGWLAGAAPNKFSQAFGISADGSTIVGAANTTGGTQAFRWTEGSGMVGLGRPAGATYGRATAVSANGGVIVGFNTFAAGSRAFRWTATGGMVDLGALPGDNVSEANAVSADGSVVVGRSRLGFGATRAFIWDAAHGMRDLRLVLVAGNPNLTDWQLETATGITADGMTIVGAGRNPNGDAEGFTAELHAVMLLERFAPSSGLPGSTVTIFGKHMATVESVKFNDVAAEFVVESDYQLTAAVPAGATTGPISLHNPGLTETSASNFAVLADSDGDGMPDSFEAQYFGSATAGAPGNDPDGDQQTNLQEFLAGTHPIDPQSTFRIIEVRRQGQETVIVFRALADKRYRVEAGADPAAGFPFTVATLPPSAPDGIREVFDSFDEDHPKRFYRAVIVR